MLKLAHIADCHLGFGRRQMPFAEADVVRSFHEAVREASAWADLIVIAGDLFDSPRLHVPSLQEALVLKSLKQPVIIVGGNHDTPATLQESSPLHLLSEIAPNLFIVSSQYQKLMIDGVEVHCVPARYLHIWREPIIPDRQDAIMVIHGVHMYSPFKPPVDTWVAPPLYDPKHFAYIAWGDLHEWHPVPTLYPPREFYAGSTSYSSTNIWNEEAPKGWLKVELPLIRVTHQTIRQRPWLTIEIDASQNNIGMRIESEFDLAYVRALSTFKYDKTLSPVLRIIFTGTLDDIRRAESSIPSLPVIKIQTTRKTVRSKMVNREGKLDICKRWVDYVSSNLGAIPKDVEPQEVIRRGLEALESGGFTAALKTLVEMDDGYYDPDDPFCR
jgi:DNA repair exonuclease SbcCD nuclease subunit